MPNYRRLFEPERLYFFTIVTHHRKPILLDYTVWLTEALDDAKKRYGFKLLAFVLLPDHLHLLMKPDDVKNYPHIIRTFKSRFSRRCEPDETLLSESMRRKGEKGTWHRRYYDHMIRDAEDL